MDSLVGYGSDDEHESDRYGGHQISVGGGGRRREDDTNYEEVNMDMSEDSQESEPELPPAERPRDPKHRQASDDSRDRERARGGSRGRDGSSGRDRRRESPRRDARESPRRDARESPRRDARESPRRDARDRRDTRRDDRPARSERGDRSRGSEGSRRGLLGDRPDERSDKQPPALMDLKPFGGEAPPGYSRSQDARDAVSPRFVDRDRRDKDREPRDRERERDRDSRDSRHGPRSEERRSREPRDGRADKREGRSRSRGAAFPPPAHAHQASGGDRRSPSGEYRPSSYKVNRKLEVMEKMGLQIKTPDGSMATAQQLRAAAHDAGASAPSYYQAGGSHRILDQVAKRKLLWAHKNKSEAEEAARWSGTRFAADSDGRQASKFMRLMGIKEPGAVKQEAPEKAVDPIKKQEELFQAMQAQYEVARATTHTMRGVGLGFQRGQY